MAYFTLFTAVFKKAGWQHSYALFFFMVFLCLTYPAATPAYADDDPFQFESTHWMSFDRYKEKTRQGGTPTTEAADTSGVDNITPPGTAAHDANGDTATGVITPPMIVPAVAAPTRAVNIPVMPGMNKGYAMRVNSTEDEKTPVAQITHIDSEPTVTLPDQNWQTPKEASRLLGKDGGDSDSDNEHQPLNVRMSFLPNSQITPVPSPEYKSTHGRKPAAVATATVPAEEPKKKVADLAACAAVDAYKKKQLEAIESDRQTLTALQSVISQLGLQKELSFMSGANGAVNQADSSTAKMDMPPSLVVPAKN